VLQGRPLVGDRRGRHLHQALYQVGHNHGLLPRLRLMDLRSPTAPWFNHSAMHAALHVCTVEPSAG
jgi:hypothetical protein